MLYPSIFVFNKFNSFYNNNKFLSNIRKISFYSPIPSKYYIKKGSGFSIYFNISDILNFNSLKERIKMAGMIHGTYVVFVKIRYSGNRYIMIGNQFGFDYKSD